MAPELPAPAAEKCGSVYDAACARWELCMSPDAPPDVSWRGAALWRLRKAAARMGVTDGSCAAGSSHNARRQAAVPLCASARAHGPGRRGAGASAPMNPRRAAQEISLRRCARVTDAGVAALAAGCLLRRLGLPGCHALGAPAVIALAGPRGCASRRCSRAWGRRRLMLESDGVVVVLVPCTPHGIRRGPPSAAPKSGVGHLLRSSASEQVLAALAAIYFPCTSWLMYHVLTMLALSDTLPACRRPPLRPARQGARRAGRAWRRWTCRGAAASPRRRSGGWWTRAPRWQP